MMIKRNRKTNVLTAFFICAVSVISVLFFIELRNVNRAYEKYFVFESAMFSTYGYSVENGVYTNIIGDAQIQLPEIDTYVNNVAVMFSEPLPQPVNITVYYAGEDHGYSEYYTASVDVAAGSEEAIILVDSDVTTCRVDISTKIGETFSLKNISLNYSSTKNAEIFSTIIWFIILYIAAVFLFFVFLQPGWTLSTKIVIAFSICAVLIISDLFSVEIFNRLYLEIFAIILILAVPHFEQRLKILDTRGNKKKWILLMSAVAFFVVFYDCILGGWRLSFSNLIYYTAPFNSLDVEIKGPGLNDVIDSQLPVIYEKIVSHKLFSLWSSSNAFGYEYNIWEWLDFKKLMYLFGLEFGQTILYILKYVLACLGMYLYLRKINLTEISSFLGGIIFAFSSVMVLWHGWQHTDVTAYAPFLFYFVEDLLCRYKKDRTYGLNNLILFSLVLFFMLVTGMPTYVPLFLYLGVIYTIFRVYCLLAIKKDIKFIIAAFVGLGTALMIAVLMSLVYTGNLLNTVSEYAEMRRNYAFHTLTLNYLRTVIVPYFRSGMSLHINESTLFTGFVFLFTIPVFLLRRHSLKRDVTRLIYFWSLVFIVVVLFVFDKNTGLIYRFIPLLNTSSKIRVIVLFNFSAAILSAQCLELVYKGESKIKFVKSFAIYAVPVIVAFELSDSMKNKEVITAIIILVLLAVCMQTILLKQYRLVMVLLSFIIVIHMSYFAKEYVPLIAKDAEMIPEATESVQYLIENTANGERMAALDTFTLFPNLNKFYGLTDIRHHGFVNTLNDIHTYLTEIDSDSYVTSTFTRLSKIDNENLLKYASVHYLLSQNEKVTGTYFNRMTTLIQTAGTGRTPYAYYGEDTISQYFKAESSFDSIALMFSTYGKILSTNDFLMVKVSDTDGNFVANEIIRLDTLLDNSFYTVMLDKIMPSGEYVIQLRGNTIFEMPLALWITGEPIYDGVLLIGDDSQAGSINFLINHQSETAISFDDGMDVEILEDSSPRAFLADTVIVKDTDEEVLNEMKSEYKANTAFITKNYEGKLLGGTDYSTSEVLEYVDNGEEVTVSVDGAKGEILVLTDYFTDSWKAYVDGKQAECLKVNYLFRGVVLPEDGAHTITFVYENTFFVKTGIVSIIGAALLLIVIIMKKRIQEFVEKKIAFRTETSGLIFPKDKFEPRRIEEEEP